MFSSVHWQWLEKKKVNFDCMNHTTTTKLNCFYSIFKRVYSSTLKRHWTLHFTDEEGRSSCPVPFKEEAWHSSYLWHALLHMTSLGRYASLCIAFRNALLSAERCVMLQVYNTTEAQRWAEQKWKAEWNNAKMLMAFRGWIMLRPFIGLSLSTVLHEIWLGFACMQYNMIKRP